MSARPGIELLLGEIEEAEARVAALKSMLNEVQPEDEERDRPVSFREMRHAVLSDPNWLWRINEASRVVGLIPPACVGFLAADSRIGKSLFLMNLGMRAARGEPFLDYPFRAPLRVLYIAAEGARPMTFRRAREVADGLSIPALDDPPFYFHPDGVPHTDYVLAKGRVDRWIERSRADLVILDTVGYFHDGDENDAMEVKRHIMRPLYERCTRFGCSFIVTHHNRKAGQGESNVDQLQRGRGSVALSSDADFWWRLEAPPPAARFVSPESRAQQFRSLHVDKNKYDEDGLEVRLIVDFRRATFSRVVSTAGG